MSTCIVLLWFYITHSLETIKGPKRFIIGVIFSQIQTADQNSGSAFVESYWSETVGLKPQFCGLRCCRQILLSPCATARWKLHCTAGQQEPL